MVHQGYQAKVPSKGLYLQNVTLRYIRGIKQRGKAKADTCGTSGVSLSGNLKDKLGLSGRGAKQRLIPQVHQGYHAGVPSATGRLILQVHHGYQAEMPIVTHRLLHQVHQGYQTQVSSKDLYLWYIKGVRLGCQAPPKGRYI